MSETVIKVENISKMYDLGLVGTGTLSKDLNRTWARLLGKPDPYATLAELNDRTQKSNSKSGSVWALKDINFEVKQGEVLGIIGKNGAGKSTLLKILSQITTPSNGEIKIKGRVASLLEVGTGMHPEMTARQNIYLNGSMMGMTRKEVTAKLDEIVDFAGIGKYIDTPIKRFSSGMTVRLGFAVAAFLEPEILIVDEVLAVGDAEFQKKAIGKMKDVSKGEGRTVLFVSHNMAAVKSLCTRAIQLEKGTVTNSGQVDKIVSKYLGGENDFLNFRNDNVSKDGFEINEIGVRAKGKEFSEPINRDEEIELAIEYNNETNYDFMHFTIKLKGEDGNYFITTSSSDFVNTIKKGKHTAIMTFPKKYFNVGSFYLDLFVVQNKRAPILHENDYLSFTVNPEPRKLGEYMGNEVGYIRANFNWKTI